MREEQAREHIEELRGWYGHLAAYVTTNLFLIIVNLLTTDYLWFLFPLLGWGIGLAGHAVQVFWTGSDWEARKLEELTGLKETKDEVQRLAERTDALVTILASVDWEKIDPELLRTRENLEAAQARISTLRDQHDPVQQAEVSREIERLEEFVTSPKFEYYDLAAKEQSLRGR